MSRDKCPRCGHIGLGASTEKRRMRGDTHTIRVWKCGECGWASA